MSAVPSGSSGVLFSADSAKRTFAVVRKVEAESAAPPPPPIAVPHAPNQVQSIVPFLAQIIAESNTSQGLYSFAKQNVQLGVIGADPSGFTTTAFQTSSAQYCAQDINGNSGIQPGTRVQMQFAGYNASNNSTYIFLTPSLEVTLTLSNSSGGGIYTGNLTAGQANGSSGSTVTGFTTGAACIAYNGPELGTSSSYPYITTPCPPVPGKIIGRDAATGKPIVSISVTSLGPC